MTRRITITVDIEPYDMDVEEFERIYQNPARPCTDEYVANHWLSNIGRYVQPIVGRVITPAKEPS